MKLFTAMLIGLAIGGGIAVLVAAGEAERDSSFKTASAETPERSGTTGA
ncbi:MAG: hypothetical protein O2888_03700 [Chloroflexi bacterium]|nr:hypothetical protein [Chloroflexota bacterium]